MSDLLLAGAKGQLGIEVERAARDAGMSLAAFDRSSLDITDRAAVMAAVRASGAKLVVNAAAYTAVDKAESEREAAFVVNRDGAAHLAEAAADAGAAIVHVSTDYVFDGSKIGAYREDDKVAPLGVYGESKLAGEEAVRRLCGEHVILRTAWVYSRHGQNFVKTMLRLAREREALRIVADQTGSPTAAGDLADAIVAIARSHLAGAMPAGGFGTFHAAGGGVTNWCDFAREIFRLSEPFLPRVPTVSPITTADYPTPARRPANSELDCAKLKAVHGIALRPWRTALADVLREPL
ncbi:dTDP-4-dehydrorhamnose reductase [Aurantimonas sp. VKM B-3413]|uniref:dTDP-4-dehydrorhamnose reductase n=1 Tax=Aurantimonas sp. VKM B-3413 TaxID=2779401 RepID=UPI001E5EA3D5|nr:dTDP-4-dehydrorhamnose reductase [Aurantimonas sp. VKM B-3413]MCB8839377.1 dTDP-4-dehydrorhamnose reductase [Aurantimonas sp. VKM B-3413]